MRRMQYGQCMGLGLGAAVAWSGFAEAQQSAGVSASYGAVSPAEGGSSSALGARREAVRPRWPRLRYEPGSVAPPGYHFESNPRKGLLLAGALTFGVPYVISVMVAGVSRDEGDRWLFVPVTGPIGAIARRRGCGDDHGLQCAGDALAVVGLAFDFAAQTAGALLFTMGYVFPKKEWVSDYEVGRRTSPAIVWSVHPRVSRAGALGLEVSGTIF